MRAHGHAGSLWDRGPMDPVHTYIDNMSGCGTSSCFGDKCWKRQSGDIFLKSMVKHFNVKEAMM